jgi:hypothetical protein
LIWRAQPLASPLLLHLILESIRIQIWENEKRTPRFERIPPAAECHHALGDSPLLPYAVDKPNRGCSIAARLAPAVGADGATGTLATSPPEAGNRWADFPPYANRISNVGVEPGTGSNSWLLAPGSYRIGR